MKKKLLSLTAVIIGLSLCSVTAFAADITATPAKSWSNFFDYLAQCPVAIAVAAASAVVVLALIIFRKPLAKKLDNSSSAQMINAFIALFAVCGIGTFAMALVSDGVTFGHLLHSENTSTGATFHFYDYLNTLRDAGSKNFEQGGYDYSPMSLLIFYVIAQFMPTKYIFSAGFPALIQMSRNQTFIYCYLIILMLLIVFTYKLNRNMLRHNGCRFRNELFAFLLVISYPALYCIKLGNIVGLSYAFLMFFIAFRDSEKRSVKEFALLSLAMSAAITPYTIIFILLFFTKDKNSLYNCSKALLYSVALFIAPAFFTGFGNMAQYIKNLFIIPESLSIENIAISNIFRFIGIDNNAVIYVLSAVFEIIALGCIFILPTAWQKSAAAVYFIINLVPSEPNAILLLVFIPLVLMLAEKAHKAIDWLYLAAFALLILPVPEWFWADRADFSAMFESLEFFVVHNANELVAPFAVQLIFVLIVCQSISALIKNKKKKSLPTE
ncbi:MAG: hypothetical protein IJZ35_06560 [Clostridia bacterium]|nr:hypothetical protein [Clostridia bacterium]